MDVRPPARPDYVAADVAYEGRPDGLVFAVGDKRLQHVYVRNGSARQRVMAKIQSTSSRKFRVRPSLALLGPHESVAVQIQLAPSERDASECKFLVVVRRVDAEEDDGSPDAGATTRRGSTATEQAQQQRDAEEKHLWQRAEARQHESLVLSETIVARVVVAVEDASSAAPMAPQAPPPLPSATKEVVAPPPLVLRIDSLETRAQVVALLMQSQSRLPPNRLTEAQLTALQRLRDAHAGEWPALEADARRMRALARQLSARQRNHHLR